MEGVIVDTFNCDCMGLDYWRGSMNKSACKREFDNEAALSNLEDRGLASCTKICFHGMIGASQTMMKVFHDIRRAAPSDFPVLIAGQTGTGKELAARAVHEESHRREGPFVPINCGALPESVLESELFGHAPGAFTGAVRQRKGRFELADGGTLFLDEVAELSLSAQVKLLRVLEDKRFERVGGERTMAVDVRIISATNKDLREEVQRGTFREDLFYRLSVVPIMLPPLSERKTDIRWISAHIIESIREKTGKSIRFIDAEAMNLLEKHPWPGNVRHLMSVLQYASIQCDGKTILPEHLPAWDFWALPSRPSSWTLESGERQRRPSRRRSVLSWTAVEKALTTTGGNKVRAAKELGVGRATLYQFLQNREHK